MKELLDLFEARNRARHVPYALATVLGVEGSSYRRPGARMLISVHGRVAGSVSGGCLEKAVISEGQRALSDGTSRLLSFDTTDQDDLALGSSLGCEGKIWIGIEVIPSNEAWLLEDVVQSVRKRREPAALITGILVENESIFFESLALFSDSVDDYHRLDPLLREKVGEVLYEQKTRGITGETTEEQLVEWLGPPVSLILFGAGPDVPPMVRLATDLGHEVTVIDRRPEFSLPENFPEAHSVVCSKPHAVASHFEADARTAVVLMNHHYDTDRDVLAALIPLKLSYIAMLGPKRRTVRILDELESGGYAIDSIRKTVHGPAGLDIGSETPEEIALSILAEIQSTLSGREGGKLRDRKQPIHVDFTRTELPCAVPA